MRYVIPVFDERVHASAATEHILSRKQFSARVFYGAYILLGLTIPAELLSIAVTGSNRFVLLIAPVSGLAVVLGIAAFVVNAISETQAWDARGADFQVFAQQTGQNFFAREHTLPMFTDQQRDTLLHGGTVTLTVDGEMLRYVPTRQPNGQHELRVFTRIPA